MNYDPYNNKERREDNKIHMKRTIEVTVRNKVGLHARPATLFVKEAVKYKAKIKVENLTNASQEVDARSLLNILTLGVQKGHTIRITAEGDDCQQAIEALVSLIEHNFYEDE